VEVLGFEIVRILSRRAYSSANIAVVESGQSLDDERVHIYDAWSNELSETRRIPKESKTVFQHIDVTSLNPNEWATVQEAESAFSSLESETEAILQYLLPIITSQENIPSKERRSFIDRRAMNTLRIFFVFLRYRNSDMYKATVDGLLAGENDLMRPFRLHAYFEGILAFLQPHQTDAPFFGLGLKESCWSFSNAEVSFGIAAPDQEYILTDRCFGTLDEELCGNDS
jgi:hypothetical protein